MLYKSLSYKTASICSLLFIVYLFSFNDCYAKKQDISYTLLHFKEGIRLHREGKLENAVLSLNTALSLNPNDVSTLIELAQVFIELSKYDLAISVLNRVLNLTPNDALAHVLLGKIYFLNNQLDKAILEYSLTLKLEPDNPLLEANVGFICNLTSDYTCSVQHLGKTILAYPFQLRVRAGLGNAYHLMKNYSLAKEQYKFVLKYEPDNFYLWYNLAKSELALGNYNEAKEYINNAISLNPSFVELYLDRGFINYKLNHLEDSENDYLMALKLAPLNPVAPAEYGVFLWKTSAYLKAAEEFNNALFLESDNKDFKIYKAYLLQLAKQQTDSINAWKEILLENNNNQVALFNLARLYQENNNYLDAIELYKKLISVLVNKDDKNILEVKSALAFCFHKNGDLEEASLIYGDILKQEPNNSIVLFNFGVLLNAQGNYGEAISVFNKAIENKFTPISSVYEALVLAYSNLNDNASLKDAYKKWLEEDTNNVNARINYAKFLAKSGDSQQAIDQYRVAATLDTTPEVKYELAKFLFELNDLYGAVGQLQEYLKVKSGDLNALVLLANAYKDLGIDEEAINYYKKIIAIQYDNHLAYYNLGLLYQKNNKYKEAQNYLLKAIELNEKYSPAYYALGLSYMSDDNMQKAKELFEKYLEIDPKGEYREKAEDALKELTKALASNQA